MHIENIEKCTGCGACFNICPVDAIDMTIDSEGFNQPSINPHTCINCDRCDSVCPAKNIISTHNWDDPIAFAFSAENNLLFNSSSGGIFSVLAESVLIDDGVCFGASFTDYFNVEHICINSIEDIEKLRFSKYVQSNIKYSYREVKKYLSEGREVLFSGTPCQISGLYNFLEDGVDTNGLITVEVICHGCPSPGIFRNYIDNEYGIDNIEKIEMRKREGWTSCFFVKLKDGTVIDNSSQKDPFQKAFHKDAILRKSCYDCKYASIPRGADLTIGDFWGVKKFDIGSNFEKKCSLILTNNIKGLNFYRKALTDTHFSFSQINLSNKGIGVKQLNSNLYKSAASKMDVRKRFFDFYNGKNIKKALYRAIYPNCVGLLLYMTDNYGSCATNYALYQAINKMGYTSLILDNLVSVLGISSRFAKKHCRLSSDFIDRDDYEFANMMCDAFVVGSDQSLRWNFGRVLGNIEYLLMAFADESKIKIGYACSYGPDVSPEDEWVNRIYKKLLSRFTSFSVREDYAVSMSKKYFDREADWVIDPVFFLDKEDYVKIASESKLKFDKPYLLAYLRYYSQDKIDLIEETAKENNLEIKVICDANNFEKLKSQYNLNSVIDKPEFIDWLSYYVNADYIVTDSFHGTCFSIIMEKKYISIKAGTTGRFESLYKLFGFKSSNELSIWSDAEIKEKKAKFVNVDYEKLKQIIRIQVDKDLNWLHEALEKRIECYESCEINSELIEHARLFKDYYKMILAKGT